MHSWYRYSPEQYFAPSNSASNAKIKSSLMSVFYPHWNKLRLKIWPSSFYLFTKYFVFHPKSKYLCLFCLRSCFYFFSLSRLCCDILLHFCTVLSFVLRTFVWVLFTSRWWRRRTSFDQEETPNRTRCGERKPSAKTSWRLREKRRLKIHEKERRETTNKENMISLSSSCSCCSWGLFTELLRLQNKELHYE